MPTCYTCHEEITFDKTIRSASGKQIPLWPDKKNTHSHDEQGNPIRQPIPQQQSQPSQSPQQQYQQRVTNKLAEIGGQAAQSQGGSYLDTKRIRVMLEELTSLVREIKDILETRVILYTNVYEGRMNAMFNAFSDTLGTIGTPASELLKQKQQRQSIIENTPPSPPLIDHSKKADEFERMKEFTKEDDDNDDANKMETED